MRVLFLTSRIPYPLWRGDQIRAYHLLRVLGRRHEVTCAVLALRTPDEAAVAAVRALGVRVEVIELGLLGAVPAILGAVWRGRPLQVALYERRRAKAQLARLAARGAFDVTHAQLLRTAPYGMVTPRATPLVVDLVDALSVSFARRARAERGLRRALWWYESGRLRAYERAVGERARARVVVAPADAAALGPDVHVIPNGVDTDTFRPSATLEIVPERIVFAGNLGYFPNVDAASWLATELLPAVRARRPAAQLRLVGARPPRRVRRLARLPGVTLAADVSDVVPELQRAAVVVVPMRSGAGMQNKALEALAVGRPLVTTTMVASAIGLVDRRHGLVADGTDEPVERIVRVLGDPALARRLGAEGRALVERRFSWTAAGEALDRLWRRVADGPEPRERPRLPVQGVGGRQDAREVP